MTILSELGFTLRSCDITPRNREQIQTLTDEYTTLKAIVESDPGVDDHLRVTASLRGLGLCALTCPLQQNRHILQSIQIALKHYEEEKMMLSKENAKSEVVRRFTTRGCDGTWSIVYKHKLPVWAQRGRGEWA